MRTVAVLDASVLHPAPLRDLLLRLARSGLYQARWTREILDECFRSILRVRPDLDPARLRRTREVMEAALPDWEITGYEAHIDQLELPDLDDRHVLAAAIEARAQVIVTANLRDFPEHALEIHGIAALSPDDLVMGLIQADIDAVLDVIEAQVAALQRPPTTVDQLHGRLERSGLASSIAHLRAAASGPEPAPRPPTRARCVPSAASRLSSTMRPIPRAGSTPRTRGISEITPPGSPSDSPDRHLKGSPSSHRSNVPRTAKPPPGHAPQSTPFLPTNERRETQLQVLRTRYR